MDGWRAAGCVYGTNESMEEKQQANKANVDSQRSLNKIITNCDDNIPNQPGR